MRLVNTTIMCFLCLCVCYLKNTFADVCYADNTNLTEQSCRKVLVVIQMADVCTDLGLNRGNTSSSTFRVLRILKNAIQNKINKGDGGWSKAKYVSV